MAQQPDDAFEWIHNLIHPKSSVKTTTYKQNSINKMNRHTNTEQQNKIKASNHIEIDTLDPLFTSHTNTINNDPFVYDETWDNLGWDTPKQSNNLDMKQKSNITTTESKTNISKAQILDQDEVQLHVIPNKNNGFTVKVLTYRKRYNKEFSFESNATLYDFLHRWEKSQGIDIGKSGTRRMADPTQKRFALLIKDNINSDTLLKNLVNENIEWYSFKPGFENNNIKQIRKFDPTLTKQKQSTSIWTHVPEYPIGIILDLYKLFTKDKEEYNKLWWALITRGWILVKFPEEYQYDIMNCSKKIGANLKKYMKFMDKGVMKHGMMKGNEWNTICNNFGYTHFKDYKSVLRIYTNKMLKRFKDKYPNNIIESIEKISHIMDTIALKILNSSLNIWQRTDYEYSESKYDASKFYYDFSEMKELCFNSENKFGMIDFVRYKNKKEKGDKIYEMLSNGSNVNSHIDPGLFSIGFFQNERGLELLDREIIDNNKKLWIEIPEYKTGKFGILWSGQYAFKVNKGLTTGIHRVNYNHNKPRLTGWYEVCIKNQIPKRVFTDAKSINV